MASVERGVASVLAPTFSAFPNARMLDQRLAGQDAWTPDSSGIALKAEGSAFLTFTSALTGYDPRADRGASSITRTSQQRSLLSNQQIAPQGAAGAELWLPRSSGNAEYVDGVETTLWWTAPAGYDGRPDRGKVLISSGSQIAAILSAGADTQPPTFAGLASATVASASTVLCTWVAGTDDRSLPAHLTYEVHCSTTPAEPFNPRGSVVGATSLTITDLLPGYQYYFRARCRDEAGNLNLNPGVEIGVTPDSPPTFAGAGGVTQTAVNTARVTWLTATDDHDAGMNIVYRVHHSTTALQPFVAAYEVTGVLSIDVIGLATGVTHYFKVRAFDTSGVGDANNSEVSISLADISPTFAGLTSAAQSAKQTVHLAWTAATDDYTAQPDIVYLVHMSTTAVQPFSETYRTVPGAVTFDVNGVSPGTYYFKVRARDAGGNVDTNVVEHPAVVTNGPPSFAGLTSTSQTAKKTVHLVWTAATDDFTAQPNIVYLVHMSTAPAQPFSETYRTTPGSTSFDVNGVPPGTYYFKVRAEDEDANVDANVVEHSVVVANDPPAFAGISVSTSLAAGQATLSWSAATDDWDPSGDIVYLVHSSALALQPFVEAYRSLPGATSIVIGGLAAGVHYFKVRAMDLDGNVDANVVEMSADVVSTVLYQMTALNSLGARVAWNSPGAPDWTGALYVGINTPLSQIMVLGRVNQ